jgi:plasmid stabilization system protein ParE
MKRTVVWTEWALGEFQRQIEYLAGRNEAAARRVLRRLRQAGTDLGIRPLGRPGAVPGTYERVPPELPCVIVYTLDDPEPRRVTILHIFHTA